MFDILVEVKQSSGSRGKSGKPVQGFRLQDSQSGMRSRYFKGNTLSIFLCTTFDLQRSIFVTIVVALSRI